MRIRVAILETDASYLNRIASVFGTRYPDKLEIYSFTDAEQAIAAATESKIDVFIAGESFGDIYNRLPSKTEFAYFVDQDGIESLNGKPTIGRFQKADLIYKQILSIFAEKAQGIVSKTDGSASDVRIVCFSSPAGGVGTSSVAAAYAKRMAQIGRRVLYLNLERFGSADEFFTGEGAYGMSDVIYEFKSKKTNLAMKLESFVKRDSCGVYFYSGAKSALDIIEMSSEDLGGLIDSLRIPNLFDLIVVDIDFVMDDNRLNLYGKSDLLIWISDGSSVANNKTICAFNALEIKSRSILYNPLHRLGILYNKFGSKTGQAVLDGQVKQLGGMHTMQYASTSQVIDKIAADSIFDQILDY